MGIETLTDLGQPLDAALHIARYPGLSTINPFLQPPCECVSDLMTTSITDQLMKTFMYVLSAHRV